MILLQRCRLNFQPPHEVVCPGIKAERADAESGSDGRPDWKRQWQSKLEVQYRQRNENPENERKHRGNQRQQHILHAETLANNAQTGDTVITLGQGPFQ